MRMQSHKENCLWHDSVRTLVEETREEAGTEGISRQTYCCHSDIKCTSNLFVNLKPAKPREKTF